MSTSRHMHWHVCNQFFIELLVLCFSFNVANVTPQDTMYLAIRLAVVPLECVDNVTEQHANRLHCRQYY